MDVKVFPANWGGIAPKPCDSCKSSAADIFCRHHSAFLCISCDSEIHNKLASHAHHERVIMCEVCEQAPAAVRCKADAAALCVTCDSDIHSANPLARRHDRVPIEPFYDSSDRAVNFLVPTNDEAEAASWILPVPSVVSKQVDRVIDAKVEEVGGDMFFSDFDHLLEFDVDSVVPVQQMASNNHNYRDIETCFEIDFCKSKLTPFNYDSANTNSNQSKLTRSNYDSANAIPHQSKHVPSSASPLDVGVVPDGRAMNCGSVGGGGVDQSTGMDREARVLRYREKRKNRKFEKTIRYASRKAYAETRPRIKGRFAKRTETGLETDPDQFLFNPVRCSDFMCDAGYGVVPSF